ncbi:MAG: FAD-dependent oxidoreductase [Actinobacteria bacterium]|nr:MAG: FAD-dependent oxidoreductase [Actinomycetota bacterium]
MSETIPWWLAEASPEPLPRRPLDRAPDVEVIGGGVTGCACALALAEGGLRVRLYEARSIAGGASGRNGGFALGGGAMRYDVARETFGRDAARAYWRLTEAYLDRLELLAGDALTRPGSLRLAADEEELEQLRLEHAALREDGFAAEWRDPEALAPGLRRAFLGGIFHPHDGSLQPARFVLDLATRAVEAGVEVREQTRVESLDDLEAERVVIATDGSGRALLPELDEVIWPARGQVVATEPLPQRLFSYPHYARNGFDYWQQVPDRRVVLGGFRDFSILSELTDVEETTPVIQEALDAFLLELLGEMPAVEYRWAGIFGLTQDMLPLVGRIPGRDGTWVAAGYSGHGNVLGLMCGELVAGAILGRPDPILELFDPARLIGATPAASRA